MNSATVAKFAAALPVGFSGVQITKSITVGALAAAVVTGFGLTMLGAGLVPAAYVTAVEFGLPVAASAAQFLANALVPDRVKEMIEGLAQKAKDAPQPVASNLPPPSTPKVAETTVTPIEAAAISVIAAETPNPPQVGATVTMAAQK